MKKQANAEIRDLIESLGLRHWEVAKNIGITAFTFCVWMREELDADKKKRVMDAIARLTPSLPTMPEEYD